MVGGEGRDEERGMVEGMLMGEERVREVKGREREKGKPVKEKA